MDWLHPFIIDLPTHVEQEDPDGGVLRPWVRALPLRYQGTLLTAIRGCDGIGREDPAKHLNRMIRRAVMNPADPAETRYKRGFHGFDPLAMESSLHQFLQEFDIYPAHYLFHLLHACEVIGYSCPERNYQKFFTGVYVAMCYVMHVNPETKSEMFHRLMRDRVATGDVENQALPNLSKYLAVSDLDVYVIYHHPHDSTREWGLRRWVGAQPINDFIFESDDLEEVRSHIPTIFQLLAAEHDRRIYEVWG